MAEILSPSFAVGTGQEELWAVGWASRLQHVRGHLFTYFIHSFHIY